MDEIITAWCERCEDHSVIRVLVKSEVGELSIETIQEDMFSYMMEALFPIDIAVSERLTNHIRLVHKNDRRLFGYGEDV